MKVTVIVSTLSLLALTACTREPQPSRIVKLAEQAGAGPLAGVSALDMRLWLKTHPQVATRVDTLCVPLRASAPAAWPQTPEGRLCGAARAVEAQRHTRQNHDTAGFLPGWK